MLLTATSIHPELLSDFTIKFEDAGDGLLQLNEVTEFSGVTITLITITLMNRFGDTLLQVPEIENVTTTSPVLNGTCSVLVNAWCFGVGSTPFLVAQPGFWRYALSPVTTAVPEPGTMSLLGAGLIALTFAGCRRTN